MTRKRIFVTGASGCIGHYIIEALIQETEHELFLMVRTPDKFKFDVHTRPGVTVLQSGMQEIEQHRELLKTIDCAILAATDWGTEAVNEVNILNNLQLMEMLDPEHCEQVLYFSTSSILDQQNQPLKEAGEIGSAYIRSKYVCYQKLQELAIAPKITTLFPTFVLGGGDRYPYSHLSAGLTDFMKWMKLIRFFSAEGSFHFLHGRDIAQVVRHLVDHPFAASQTVVLGNEKITVDQAIEEACDYIGQKLSLRIPLSLWLADFFIVLFRIQMAEWDRFSLQYRHFTYKNLVNPATFGREVYCANLYDVLKLSGVPKRSTKVRSLHPFTH
jgi:nucleoside-diphosphate-sugar epimerase